jgi:hypothetical protein
VSVEPWQVARSVFWLVVWALAAAACGYVLATSWPYQGHGMQFPMVVAMAGVVSRTMRLVSWRIGRTAPVGWKWGIAKVFIGLLACATVWPPLQQLSLARFERALAPWVAQVHAAAEPCTPLARWRDDATYAAYVRSTGGPRDLPSIAYVPGRFAIWTAGGSFDIDGSTVWYDSGSRAWTSFHNDASERRNAFEAMVRQMTACDRVTLPPQQPPGGPR